MSDPMKPLFPRAEAWAAANAGLVAMLWWLSVGAMFGVLAYRCGRLEQRVADLEECE
jgi:hypothetical protein